VKDIPWASLRCKKTPGNELNINSCNNSFCKSYLGFCHLIIFTDTNEGDDLRFVSVNRVLFDAMSRPGFQVGLHIGLTT